MQYMLLIYGDENAWESDACPRSRRPMQGWLDYTEWLKDTGTGTSPGTPSSRTTAATTVRVRDGKTITTDGPFAETKEQLGGYYLIEAANLDEAIEAAAQMPRRVRRDRSRSDRSRSTTRRAARRCSGRDRVTSSTGCSERSRDERSRR